MRSELSLLNITDNQTPMRKRKPLTDLQLANATAAYDVLGDLVGTTLARWIRVFEYDPDCDQEILYWLRAARTMLRYQHIPDRPMVLRAITAAMTGTDVERVLHGASTANARKMREIYETTLEGGTFAPFMSNWSPPTGQ